MSNLREKIEAHIRQMAPHHREREAGKLLIEAAAAISSEPAAVRDITPANCEPSGFLVTGRDWESVVHKVLQYTMDESKSLGTKFIERGYSSVDIEPLFPHPQHAATIADLQVRLENDSELLKKFKREVEAANAGRCSFKHALMTIEMLIDAALSKKEGK